MAASDVSISNLALQMLGASRIASLTEDSPAARSCNACYEAIRDAEIRKNRWNFAKTRTTLAPHATAPAFTFNYAFPLPSDYLRLLSPNEDNNIADGGRNDTDWKIERHQGTLAVLTNDGTSLDIVYLARVTDPAQFDALFVIALAAAMAEHMCEEITQSSAKKEYAASKYKAAIADAKKVNAIENQPTIPPEDTWSTARL